MPQAYVPKHGWVEEKDALAFSRPRKRRCRLGRKQVTCNASGAARGRYEVRVALINMNRSSVIDLTDESPTPQPHSVPDEDVSVLNVRLVSPPYRTRRRRQRHPVVDVDAMPEAPAGCLLYTSDAADE